MTLNDSLAHLRELAAKAQLTECEGPHSHWHIEREHRTIEDDPIGSDAVIAMAEVCEAAQAFREQFADEANDEYSVAFDNLVNALSRLSAVMGSER